MPPAGAGPSTVTGALTLTASAVTQSGAVSVGNNVTINAGANDVTLTNAGNDFATIGVTGGNVSLRDANALDLGERTPAVR